MSPDEFRRLALALPEAIEGSHMGHADFRVGGKIFATLGPKEDWGMVSLPLEEQQARVAARPDVFELLAGAWGRGGATRIWLAAADPSTAKEALDAAWRKRAPKRLLRPRG